MEPAFAGPSKILARFGTLDPGRIAAADPARSPTLCATPPAIHRYGRSMAGRVQALAAVLDELRRRRGADLDRPRPGRPHLLARLKALPGFGDQKARIFAGPARQAGRRQPAGGPRRPARTASRTPAARSPTSPTRRRCSRSAPPSRLPRPRRRPLRLLPEGVLPALRVRLVAAQREHVLVPGRTIAARPGQVVVARPGARVPARRRPASRRLALDELGGGGDLVGDARHRHRERLARRIRRARAGRRTTCTPAAPIATSVWPSRHGRPSVSREDDADRRRRCARGVPVRERARRGVGVDGQQQHGAVGGVDRVDARRRRDDAQAVLDDAGTPPACSRVATTRTVSSVIACSRSAAATTRPSAFETIFDVTTRMSPSSRLAATASTMSATRSSPAAISGMPVDAPTRSSRRHRTSPGSTSRPKTSIHSRWLRPTLCR